MSFMSTISIEDFNEVSMYDMVNDTYDVGESSEMGSKRNQEEDRGEDKGEVGEEVGEWTQFLNKDFDEVTMYDMVNDIYDIDKGESSEMGPRKRNREDGGEDKGEEVGEGSRKRIHLDDGEGDEEKQDFDMNDEEGEDEEENEVEIKLSKKRMSDRISAARYRKKKRDEVENLIQVEKELEEKNKFLRDEINGFFVELFELKEFMFLHDINCPLGPF
ncbi:hypothetical protein Glove_19g378 [Diversispora epigaea]|uniref:BZIP domain-containing protein n=1 Tax=Diversispora epigaea TaxID=1348612 RepID=A0A397JMR7_9GLOM|nr:hypothetical protein Glove_19g378 [Diversispora epigaea]